MFFHEEWPDRWYNTLKIDDFDEEVVTRESICGKFPPGGWAWGPIWDRLFRKLFDFGKIGPAIGDDKS